MFEYARKMLSWRMANDERTLTGMRVGPKGLIERMLTETDKAEIERVLSNLLDGSYNHLDAFMVAMNPYGMSLNDQILCARVIPVRQTKGVFQHGTCCTFYQSDNML